MQYSSERLTSLTRGLCIVAMGLLYLLLPVETLGQSSHQIFEHLTTDDGLSSNKVEAILQDKEGFFWIATQNGLNRYDGTTFKVFRHDTRDTASLTHNHCTALVEGADGNIWIATYKGVSRFNKSTGDFTRITLQPSENFELANRINAIVSDSDGNIWISGNALWKYDLRTSVLTPFVHTKDDVSSIPAGSQIRAVVSDTLHKGLWVTVGSDLCFYSLTAHTFYNRRFNPPGWKVFNVADGAELALDTRQNLWFRDKETQCLASFDVQTNTILTTLKKADHGIKHIVADPAHNIWILYWTFSAEILNPYTGECSADFLQKYHQHSALSDRAVNLFVDRHGNYWIASDKGISIYNANNQFYKIYQPSFLNKSNDDLTDKIRALAQCEEGSLWIGTSQGLYRYELTSARFEKTHIPDEAVYGLCSSGGDTLWIGLRQTLLGMDVRDRQVFLRKELPKGFYSMQYGDGSLWFTYWLDGLLRYTPATDVFETFPTETPDTPGLRSNHLVTGLPDQDVYWVGYNGGIGFSRLDLREHTWHHFHPQEENLSSSNAGTTTVLTNDLDGRLWLGTHGAGVFYCNFPSGTYENYQQEDGLNSNYINSILVGPAGALWISTSDGINYVHRSTHTIRSLDIDLPFPNNDHRISGAYGLHDLLYFYNNNTLVEIDPCTYQPDTAFLPIVLSGFRIFDREIPIPSDQEIVSLSHRENFFSFTYSAVGTRPGTGIRYAYKLEGFDKTWHETGDQQTASYTNVPGGEYVFRVRSTNEDGHWNPEIREIHLHISPPFWKTWWFLLLCALTLASIILALHTYRIRQVKKIYSVRTQISRDLHDDIGASLSSINIYSTVAESEVKENPEVAREIIQQINKNSRQVMDNISDIVWANRMTKSEDISISSRVKNYGYDLLSGKNIECLYDIDPYIDRKLTVPDTRKNVLLIIKEALNNIAKYSEATTAEVRIFMQHKFVHVEIRDNGKGFHPESMRSGNGLIHMRQRAEAMSGTLGVHSTHAGTTVTVTIPLTRISD